MPRQYSTEALIKNIGVNFYGDNKEKMNEEIKKEKDISVDREELKKEIKQLSSLCSVSGSEHKTVDEIKRIYGKSFDLIESDAVGNHILFRSCTRKNAPKIMIDAHYDEIGFMVTEVLDGGFLRITNIGGIDRAIMQSAFVTVYGKEKLDGTLGASARFTSITSA